MKTSEDDPSPPTNGNSAEVGYRRPPKEYQFKKGQSGNPTGRPRKKHLEEDLTVMGRDELLRPIAVLEDGKKMKMPLIQAVFRRQLMALAKGERPMPKFLCDILFAGFENSARSNEQMMKDVLRDILAEDDEKICPDGPVPEKPVR